MKSGLRLPKPAQGWNALTGRGNPRIQAARLSNALATIASTCR
jgi:hypothetical protein